MIVDINIFGAVPARVRSEFPNLETLSIAFYAYKTIQDEEPGGYNDLGDFNSTDSGLPFTKFVKRANWIVASATEAMEAVKKTIPHWRIPTIEALLRKVNGDKEDLYEGMLDFEDERAKNRAYEDEEQDPEDDDEHATAKMTYSILKQQIRQLKHRHHPSRRIGFSSQTVYPGKTYRD